MKICLVTNQQVTTTSDGEEHYVDRLARGLADSERVVVIATGSAQPFAPNRQVSRDGISVHMAAPMGIGAIVAREQPDIVHIHNHAGFSLSAISMGAGGRMPLALTLRNYRLLCTAGTMRHAGGRECKPDVSCRLAATLNRRVTSSVGLVISPSHYALDQHVRRGFFGGAIQEVLPYGLEPLAAALVESKPTYDLLWIGRVQSNSGLDVLIRSFQKVHDPNLRLHIAAIGPAVDEETRLAAGDDRIRLYGAASEVRRSLIEKADCIVVPSLWPENFPVGIQEAFRSGTPIIASRVGGIPEVVRDGVNGLLVEPGDEAMLRGTIEELRRSPERASRIRSSALETGRLYDMRFHVARLLEAYQRLLRSNRLRPFDQRAA